MTSPYFLCRVFCLGFVILAMSGSDCFAQAGLRKSLELLDKNQDGLISPDEITPLARPYFEQISRSGSSQVLRLEQANRIDRIQDVARRYYATKNGAKNDSVQPKLKTEVLPFRPSDDEVLVPQFGSDVRYPYTRADLERGSRLIKSYDKNKDGFLDAKEAMRVKWSRRDPFDDDFDNDHRLSALELAQRFSRRRVLDRTSGELYRKAIRAGSGIKTSTPTSQSKTTDMSQWWRKGGSDYWLTAALMGRFDYNKNSKLEGEELERLGIPVFLVDVDRNSEVTRDELFAYLRVVQDELGGSNNDPPEWFYERDANGDGQIAMSEFSEELSPEDLAEFGSYDRNNDGLITDVEALAPQGDTSNAYGTIEAEYMPPRKTVVSEIEIDDDFVIGDLDVQISLSHSKVSTLDAYLVGPGGERVELFTAIGGTDDIFDGTIFDDQAEQSITRAPPPYKGSFGPEALVKKQPGLAQFNGATAKGAWQLIIRGARSDRPGVLHYWRLLVKPQSEQDQTEQNLAEQNQADDNQAVGSAAEPSS